MNLKSNIIANFLSQFYITLIGIAMLPLYIKYLGEETYGLVGFFATLQALFQMLDLGLTPTMARETARYQGGAMDALSLRRLLRTLEGIFIGVALLGAAGIIATAKFIATMWLNVQFLPLNEVRNAVMLMGVIVALRWTSGLYRGTINGFEKMVWLSSWNAFIATLRFVLVIPFFIFIGTSPTYFFSYQLGVALIELAMLVNQTYCLLPNMEAGKRTPWQWQPLRTVLKFSLSIAFTGSVWVLVTQVDKLVLSKLLPLAEYGYFSLAVLLASGVMMVSGPISSAIIPRMTRLQAAGDEAGLIQLYRKATQLVAFFAIPSALVLVFFAKQVLWAWTGDAILASNTAPVLSLYAMGSGILVLGAFPSYLQFAKGDLKLHLIGSFLFVLFLTPSLLWATWQFGMVGAGGAWLSANLIYFLVWVPLVHQYFSCELHWTWLTKDVIFTCVPAILFAWLVHQAIPWPVNRLATAVQLCVFGMLLLVIMGLSSSNIRELMSNHFNMRR